jgi:hypothetical protein
MTIVVIPNESLKSVLVPKFVTRAIQIIVSKMYNIGIENSTLNFLMLIFTSWGSLSFNPIAIAQIQPKVPIIKNIIVTGKSVIINFGFVNEKILTIIPGTHVNKKSCQCFSFNKKFMTVYFRSKIYCCQRSA